VSESIANTATPSVSAFASPNDSPNPSRVGSQVSVVSGHQSQASGGRGVNVTQRHKNLVNMNAALMASAQGDWVRTEEILRGLVAINPNDFVVSRSGSSFVRFRASSLHSGLLRLSVPVSFYLHLASVGRAQISVPFRQAGLFGPTIPLASLQKCDITYTCSRTVVSPMW
jgi:hypothetical protein